MVRPSKYTVEYRETAVAMVREKLSPLAPMSSSSSGNGGGSFGIGEEGVEDDVGQSPFEDSDGFGLVVSAGSASFEEGLRVGW